jgi:hypothetical protein
MSNPEGGGGWRWLASAAEGGEGSALGDRSMAVVKSCHHHHGSNSTALRLDP